MKRRNLIRAGTGAVFTGGIMALAGCSGSQDPPPRKSSVFEDAELNGNTIEVPLSSDTWVMTRMDGTESGSDGGDSSNAFLASLSPIGVASAKGRGATGRGTSSGFSSAPKTSRGFGWYGWGAYASTWYDENEDTVRQVPVNVTSVGLAYLGDNESFQEQAPGPGAVEWDVTKDQVEGEEAVSFEDEIDQTGWYRLGVQVRPEDSQDVPTDDLGWESLDFRVEEENGELTVTEEWKVSPRI